MKITTIGIDLAKIVFQIHGVDERGKVAARKQLKRWEMRWRCATLPYVQYWLRCHALSGIILSSHLRDNAKSAHKIGALDIS